MLAPPHCATPLCHFRPPLIFIQRAITRHGFCRAGDHEAPGTVTHNPIKEPRQAFRTVTKKEKIQRRLHIQFKKGEDSKKDNIFFMSSYPVTYVRHTGILPTKRTAYSDLVDVALELPNVARIGAPTGLFFRPCLLPRCALPSLRHAPPPLLPRPPHPEAVKAQVFR